MRYGFVLALLSALKLAYKKQRIRLFLDYIVGYLKALKNKEVKRIILTRPAVEAGENLGFLPGDLKEKLDP